MKRVGIDIQATLTSRPSGLAVYVRSLVENLIEHANGRIEIVPLQGKFKTDLNTWQRYYHDRFELSKLAAQAKVDILHQPAFSCPRSSKPVIWTIHDLRPIVSNEAMSLTARWYWKKHLPHSARWATKIICTSESAKQEVQQIIRPAQEPGVIGMGLPVGIESFRFNRQQHQQLSAAHGITGSYIVSVGTLQPIKNFPFLINVFQRLHQANPNQQLVIIGDRGWGYEAVRRAIETAGLTEGKDVIITGFINDSDKWSLISQARAFLFPSLNEGYGLPPLEAQYLGVPVVSSPAGALKSVLGDGAIFAPPTDLNSWLSAAKELGGKRQALTAAGRQNVVRHSWERVAEEWLTTYEQVG
jgi:glycosyltransferase involved in cell wall biosynthesis